MTNDVDLFRAAEDLIRERFGTEPWSGAAAMRLEDGRIVTSTAPGSLNPSVELCHETGALCEAFKLGLAVTATVCVTQPEPNVFLVLAPCGVCQERLFFYGPNVEAGVPLSGGDWTLMKLDELQPHHWRRGLPAEN